MLQIICIVFIVSAVAGQNIDTSVCQCEIADGRGRWIGDTKEFCSGCDPVVQRLCLLSNGETISCRVTLNCTVRECTGHWSPWDNDGPCDQSCGQGVQKQKRICYKHGNSSMRYTLCRGSYGKKEESRLNLCQSARDCSSKIGTMTRSTRTTPTAKAKISYGSTITATIHKITVSASTTNAPGVLSTDPQNLILPLVLSSVALVCIGVSIAFVIILRKKAKDKKLSHSSGSSGSNTADDIMRKQGDHLYEEVGPVLLRGRNSNMHADNSTKPEVVPNILYTPFECQKGYEVPIENLELNSGNNSSTSNHQTVNGNTAVIREDGYITLDDIK